MIKKQSPKLRNTVRFLIFCSSLFVHHLEERYWQEYVEPMDCSMSASMAISAEDTGLLPLAKGILTDNCGVNFIVVITKSDLG